MASISTEETISRDILESRLKDLAEEISADLAQLDSSQSKELLSDFVSELFFNMAKQSHRELRRQKQAEGIAAAKARGVRFGTRRKPLSGMFPECYKAWKNGQMTQTRAAELCGVSRATFCREVNRLEQGDNYSV